MLTGSYRPARIGTKPHSDRFEPTTGTARATEVAR